MNLKIVINYACGAALIFSFALIGEDYRNRKNTIKKSNEAVAICKEELTRVLTGIKTNGKNISDLTRKCHDNYSGNDCAELSKSAKDLMSILDGDDLGKRWNWFSCSPLLFSKMRQLRNKADQIEFLTKLKRPTQDMLNEGKSILEPGMFIENMMTDTQKRCCEDSRK